MGRSYPVGSPPMGTIRGGLSGVVMCSCWWSGGLVTTFSREGSWRGASRIGALGIWLGVLGAGLGWSGEARAELMATRGLVAGGVGRDPAEVWPAMEGIIEEEAGILGFTAAQVTEFEEGVVVRYKTRTRVRDGQLVRAISGRTVFPKCQDGEKTTETYAFRVFVNEPTAESTPEQEATYDSMRREIHRPNLEKALLAYQGSCPAVE